MRDRTAKKRLIAEAHLDVVSAGTPRSPAERGFEDCPCPKSGCDLRGDCVPCVAYHGRKGRPPRCER